MPNRHANPAAASTAAGRQTTRLALIVGLCLAYFLLAKAGLALASIHPSATPV